jgi:Flp pilus assembly protein TadD
MRGGSPQTALQLASNVLSRAPTNEAALVVQGDALTELGRLTEARDSYNHALQSNPASVGAMVGLGRISLVNDPAGAQVLFLHALDRDPRNTKALNDLGVARDLLGDHAGAQQAYRRALGIDPDDSAAQVNMALSMAMSGSADEAVRMLRPMASDPNSSRKLRHDLAAALAMAGKQDEATRILSADLSPAEVRQALEDYAAARSGSAGALQAATQGSEAAVALAPVADRSGAPAPVVAAPDTATPAPAPAPPPAAASASAVGAHVQFSTVHSESDARADWRRLQHRMPSLLASHQPIFTHPSNNDWHVRTGGFANASQASAFCQQVRAAGSGCMVSEP